jgi:hypothetical protein
MVFTPRNRNSDAVRKNRACHRNDALQNINVPMRAAKDRIFAGKTHHYEWCVILIKVWFQKINNLVDFYSLESFGSCREKEIREPFS